MLTSEAYSFRLKSRLAISLSWVAGYTNVVTFVLCGGVVVSHTTGNVTHFAERVGALDFHAAAYFGWLILTFLLGAVCSAVMTERAWRRGARSRYILPMAVQALLLSVMAIGVDFHHRLPVQNALSSGHHLWTLYWITGVGSLAMGLQNATITRISGAVVRTTHLTGVVTDIGIESVQLLLWYRDRTRTGRIGRLQRLIRLSKRNPTVLRLALLASILGSFLFGAVVGTFVFHRWPHLALVAPVLFLLWIILMDWLKPIADLRELDLTADAELRGMGFVTSLLPADIGIYRLTNHRKQAPHRMPDFEQWVMRVPHHWRTIILTVSPFTTFQPESAMNLRAAAETLAKQNRKLILCGIGPRQFKLLVSAGVTEVVEPEDICPDLEFAIARAIHRSEPVKD